jgi:hypothetical protein
MKGLSLFVTEVCQYLVRNVQCFPSLMPTCGTNMRSIYLLAQHDLRWKSTMTTVEGNAILHSTIPRLAV